MLNQKNLKVPDTNKPITLVVAAILTAALVLTVIIVAPRQGSTSNETTNIFAKG